MNMQDMVNTFLTSSITPNWIGCRIHVRYSLVVAEQLYEAAFEIMA